MTCAIGAASANGARGRTSCKRQVSGSIPLTGSQVREGIAFLAGLDDASIETGPIGGLADFSREAPSLAEAIASAVRDIDKVPGLRAVGVQCDNMVTATDIASMPRLRFTG